MEDNFHNFAKVHHQKLLQTEEHKKRETNPWLLPKNQHETHLPPYTASGGEEEPASTVE